MQFLLFPEFWETENCSSGLEVAKPFKMIANNQLSDMLSQVTLCH